MIGHSVFSWELLFHDFRSHFKRQKKLWKCCYEFTTLQLDYAMYRNNHGYPKYYERITCNNDEIKNFDLEQLYQLSLKAEAEDKIKPVYT